METPEGAIGPDGPNQPVVEETEIEETVEETETEDESEDESEDEPG